MNENNSTGLQSARALVIVMSYHHCNTGKLAAAMAGALDAPVKIPQQVRPDELGNYNLIGFGSGIYNDMPHPALFDLVERMPPVLQKKVFLFSTSGIPAFVTGDKIIEQYCIKSHRLLRDSLVSKGCTIAGEFGCAGFNTNSILRFFGGFNNGRPNAADLQRARTFAANLRRFT